MQNVIQASLVPAVNSHVTVQVEGHVTLRPDCAAKDVLLGFRGTSVNWVRQSIAFMCNKGRSYILKNSEM